MLAQVGLYAQRHNPTTVAIAETELGYGFAKPNLQNSNFNWEFELRGFGSPIHPPDKYPRRHKHDEAVDRGGHRHQAVAQHIEGDVDRQRAVVDADFHGNRDGLFSRQIRQSRRAVTDAERCEIEYQTGQADDRKVFDEGCPLLRNGDRHECRE